MAQSAEMWPQTVHVTTFISMCFARFLDMFNSPGISLHVDVTPFSAPTFLFLTASFHDIHNYLSFLWSIAKPKINPHFLFSNTFSRSEFFSC